MRGSLGSYAPVSGVTAQSQTLLYLQTCPGQEGEDCIHFLLRLEELRARSGWLSPFLSLRSQLALSAPPAPLPPELLKCRLRGSQEA